MKNIAEWIFINTLFARVLALFFLDCFYPTRLTSEAFKVFLILLRSQVYEHFIQNVLCLQLYVLCQITERAFGKCVDLEIE